MNSIFDSYISMAYGYLHILQFMFLVGLFFLYNRYKNVELKQRILFTEKTELIIVVFYVVMIFLNIYIVYNQNNSVDYEAIPKNVERMRFFFERINERMFVFWISQIFISLLALYFYIIINLKKQKWIKSL